MQSDRESFILLDVQQKLLARVLNRLIVSTEDNQAIHVIQQPRSVRAVEVRQVFLRRGLLTEYAIPEEKKTGRRNDISFVRRSSPERWK